MSKRRLVITAVLAGATQSEVVRRYGVTQGWVSRLMARYAAEGADALVIVTEWDEFRALDLEKLATLMRGNVLVDLRNVYDPEAVRRAGLQSFSIGRGSSDG